MAPTLLKSLAISLHILQYHQNNHNSHCVQASEANAYDVYVRLYNDQNCFEQHGERTFAPSLTDIRTTLFTQDTSSGSVSGGSSGGSASVICYANTFSNVSFAFDLSIVRMFPTRDPETGEDVKVAVNLRQYNDHCRTMGGLAPIQAKMNQCTPFLGPYYAFYKLVPRTIGCSNKECSAVQLVRQEFYGGPSCLSAPIQVYKYPIKQECMRYYNGTQTFATDSTLTNITEKDYEGSRNCQGVTLTYNMRMNYCYPLYGSKSFMWKPDDDYNKSFAISSMGSSSFSWTSFFMSFLFSSVSGFFMLTGSHTVSFAGVAVVDPDKKRYG